MTAERGLEPLNNEALRTQMAEIAGTFVRGYYTSLNLAQNLYEAGETEGATLVAEAAEEERRAVNGLLEDLKKLQ